jgi:hypothetical protein
MRDPLADAITAVADRPATSFRTAKSSTQAGRVSVAGADIPVSPWIGSQPPAGDPVLLLMAEDGSSVAVSGAGAAGHARGDIGSLAVPTATATRITTLTSTAFDGTEVTASSVKLIKAGYWNITVHLAGLLVASGQRSFISFIVNNNVLARMQGGSPGENLATASATIYFTANRLLEFDCYTAGSATTVTGKFYIKYLGAS